MKSFLCNKQSCLVLLLGCLLSISLESKAQTTLSAGDVVIVGWNATDNSTNTVSADDNFDFLLLKDVAAGTQVYFTDLGWIGSAFQQNENNGCSATTGAVSDGCVKWTASTAMNAGTQVRVDCKVNLTASSGTITGILQAGGVSTYMSLATGTDQIFAFQGSLASPTLIAAVQYGSGSWTAGVIAACSTSSSISNDPGLSVGSYAMLYTSTLNNNYYSGTTVSGTASILRTAILNTSNWTGNDVTTFTFPLATTFAAGIVWQGTTNNWSTTSNWSCTCVPSGTDDVIIPDGASAYPTISAATVSARTITIGSAASLTVSGTGVLQISGSINNSGTFAASAGGITFNGSTAQTIPASAFTSNTIEDLVINNSAGVTIGGTLNIAATGSLIVSSGTFTTGGFLTMLSTASGTARIGNSAGTISGNVTIQRYIAGGRRAYRFLGHPLTTSQNLSILTDDIDITGTGGVINGFTGTTTNKASAFWYNGATANGNTSLDPGWTAYTTTNGGSTANTWDKGEGLLIFIRGAIGQGLNGAPYTPSAVTLDMTGAVNQGSQVITVTKGTNTTYALVGNPLPSQVSMSALTRGGGISSFYYTYDARSGSYGAYTARLYSNGEILPSCGAFIADLTSSSTITFNESSKSSSTPMSTIFKTTAVNDHLLLHITSNQDTISWDQLEVYFDNATLNDSDANDAPKFVNPELNLYTYSNDNKHLAIDMRPYKDGEIIPLGINSAPENSYALKAEQFIMSAGTNVFLHDKYLNKVQQLSPGYVYNFDVTSDPLSQGGRFALQTSGIPAKVEGLAAGVIAELAPNPARDIVNVAYKVPAAGKAEIHIINIHGAVCYSVVAAIQTSGVLQLPVKDLPAGLYVVEFACSGQKVQQKFIKE
jgi:hypothetical protein